MQHYECRTVLNADCTRKTTGNDVTVDNEIMRGQLCYCGSQPEVLYSGIAPNKK